MKKSSIVLCSILLLLPTICFAVDPLHRDSAFIFKHPADKKKMEKKTVALAALEFYLAYSKYGDDSLLSPEIDLTAVVVNKIEVVLAVPYLLTRVHTLDGIEKENGISDADIFLKWSFYDRSNAAIALISDLVLPTGNEKKGLGDGSASFMVGGIVSKKIDDLKLSTQLGFQINNSDSKDFLIYGATGVYILSEKALISAQVKGHTSSVIGSKSNVLVAKLGFGYTFTKHVELYFGGARRITLSGPDFSAFIDFIYNF